MRNELIKFELIVLVRRIKADFVIPNQNKTRSPTSDALLSLGNSAAHVIVNRETLLIEKGTFGIYL